MLSLPVGFVAMLVVIYLSVEKGLWGFFYNVHSITIVVGGTLGVFLLSTPGPIIRATFRSLRELANPSGDFSRYWPEIAALSRSRRLVERSRNALINYAADLWEAGVSADLFVVLLSQKRTELENAGTDAVQALKNLSKYPPALGMTGTVIGLVGLFSKLNEDSRAGLGPALAMAMTATFFGLIMANVLIMPLADRLLVQHIATRRTLTMTYRALVLIHKNESIELIADQSGQKAA